MARIAVIDDEGLMRDLIGTSMSRMNHDVATFENGDKFLNDSDKGQFDLIITDLKMPGISGIDVAEAMLRNAPKPAVILMTAYGTVEGAVRAMKLGVSDFIEKPFQIEMLEHTVSKVLELKGLKSENEKLKASLSERYTFIGDCPVVRELLSMVDDFAASKSTVLISGESGTGKELIAHAIHSKSLRLDAPFVKINCAAIPENLIESELFGHEKGAYTGAVKSRIGKFEEASGGTLLLDEIGEMPMQAQSKLLRVLQESELSRVGSNISVSIDVRVICTTNRNLEKEVEDGNFREDLYYRLNVIPVKMPSLRERKEDIPLLIKFFIEKYNKENGFTVPDISSQALGELMLHTWPGNVRELENVIQRAVVFAKYSLLERKHLRFFEQKSNPNELSLTPGMSIGEMEKQLILKTLRSCDGNRTKAAEILDISVRTLRNKLKEYQLDDKKMG